VGQTSSHGHGRTGVVQQRDDPKDKRAAILSLTDKIGQLRDQIVAVWEGVDQIIIAAIGAENATQLFQQSGALRDALGGEAPMTQRDRVPKG